MLERPSHRLTATLAAGGLGGWAFSVLALPLPWILGAIFGVMVATRTPLPLTRPGRAWLTPARMVLGLAIGSTFSPAILDHAAAYAVSLLFLIPFIAVSAGLGILYFKRVLGMDAATAFLAALPGGLAELLLLGDDLRADVRRIALIQATRILALVYVLPFVAGAIADQDLGAKTQIVGSILHAAPENLLMLAVLGIAGWRLLAAVGISGAPIVGPMIACAVATLAGVVDHGPPDEIFKVAQWLLGSSIGAFFIGASGADMLRTFRSSLGFLLILAAVTAVTAFAVHEVTGIGVIPTLLAFAPGGQAEMSLIAIMLREDPAYVALHHLVRLLLIVTFLPPIARLYFGRGKGGKDTPLANER